jgi:hypothetical protein
MTSILALIVGRVIIVLQVIVVRVVAVTPAVVVAVIPEAVTLDFNSVDSVKNHNLLRPI